MNYDKFIKLSLSKSVVATAAYHGNISWTFLQELAEMTKDIDYQCNFDKNGLCKRTRKSKSQSPKGCCGNCHNTFGYLRTIPASEDGSIEREIVDLFDETNGFWREGKGCILPLKYRSSTCLLYMCDAWKVYKVLSQKERMALRVLGNPMPYYPDYVKLLKEQKIRSVNDFINTIISEENSM